jgi:hypothetical protein
MARPDVEQDIILIRARQGQPAIRVSAARLLKPGQHRVNLAVQTWSARTIAELDRYVVHPDSLVGAERARHTTLSVL